MMYVTGDCHGDWRRFSKEAFPEQASMTDKDYVLVLGDFGLWDDSSKERWWLDWMEQKNFTLLFVDGNHENFDMLYSMPVQKWNGGDVHFVRKNVVHLMRGQVYTLDDKKFFTFGGASSHDVKDGVLDRKDPNFKSQKKRLDASNGLYRVNHETWWEQELPSKEEMQTGLDNLKKVNNKVNFVVSHDCPSSLYPSLHFDDNDYQTDVLTDYLETVKQNTDFNVWFFGHHHLDEKVNNKFVCLYEQFVKLY